MSLTCLPCLIGYGLVGASLATSLAKPPEIEGLTQAQRETKERIVQERKRIYFTSLAIGVILAIIYLQYIGPKKATYGQLCTGLLILTSTTHLMYTLWPKTTFMVEHLEKEQVPDWVATYKEMSRRYHLGFILGASAFFMISKGLKC